MQEDIEKNKIKVDPRTKRDILESIMTGRLYYSTLPNPSLEEIDLNSVKLEGIEEEIDKMIWSYDFIIDSEKKLVRKETKKRIKKILKEGSE